MQVRILQPNEHYFISTMVLLQAALIPHNSQFSQPAPPLDVSSTSTHRRTSGSWREPGWAHTPPPAQPKMPMSPTAPDARQLPSLAKWLWLKGRLTGSSSPLYSPGSSSLKSLVEATSSLSCLGPAMLLVGDLDSLRAEGSQGSSLPAYMRSTHGGRAVCLPRHCRSAALAARCTHA